MRTFRGLAAGTLALAGGILLAGCPQKDSSVPAPGTKEYEEAASAFFTGTIALVTGEPSLPEPKLTRVVTLAPDEPAGWANRAIYYLRKNDLGKAAADLEKAKALAADNDQILLIDGLIADRNGKFDEALRAYQAAAAKNPRNVKALFLVGKTAERQNGPDRAKVVAGVLEALLKVYPGNVYALAERLVNAGESGDREALSRTVELLEPRLVNASPEARKRLAELKGQIAAAPPETLRRTAMRLRPLLIPDPSYQAGRRELDSSDAPGQPLERLLKMANPAPTPAAPDTGLKYAIAPEPVAAQEIAAYAMDSKSAPFVFLLNNGVMSRLGANAAYPLSTRPAAMAAFDLDNEPSHIPTGVTPPFHFQLDLAIAGQAGLTLFKNQKEVFVDSTAAAHLPAAVTKGAYTGVWSVDLEADGDMDLVLSPASGDPVVLQNNGDSTFAAIKSPFPKVPGPLRAFAWADIDGDGDADALLVDKDGALHVFENQRSGLFRERPAPGGLGKLTALAVAELTGDATLDVAALQEDGAVRVVADSGDGQGWQDARTVLTSKVAEPAGLFAGDLDNNGGIDLAVAGKEASEIFLSDAKRAFGAPQPVALRIRSIADLDGDGLLDLVGLAGGKAVRARASGTENYGWQSFTLVAGNAVSANLKINPFCVGGEAEMRAGLLYQKQPIVGPQVHFGLGEYKQLDIARIIWPSGLSQSEAGKDLKLGSLVIDQRLLSSCPFLFAWDGQKMVFVTDCIWRSPLGLKINAQDTAGVTQTEDWVKVRGDQLAPRDGFYNLSITAELWETHFFDKVALMAVDHPEGSEVYVDERFSPVHPPTLSVIPTKTPHAFAQVLGWKGQDVSDVVAERDGRHLDDFGRTRYQGIAGDHWVELELGNDAPRGKPLYLIAYGWLHPTDTSINVALGQNKSMPPPSGLAIEARGADGRWRKVRDGLGFPAGKVKTVVLRIDDVFAPGAPRRLRLRTNLEIYWDQLQWAEALPGATARITRIAPRRAELRYRGFSDVVAANASSPELPQDYDQLLGTGPRWRDLVGFHTRFGDVLPLVGRVDDRYVIMNAGDEMALRFPEAAPPKAGWKRDFVFIGDGWEKDGNLNTTFGKTVLPLPAHDIKDYRVPPTTLEADPVYRRHPDDWVNYHTRYVTPRAFAEALLTR